MFCKNCGSELKEGARFCGKCGTPIGSSNAPTRQNAPESRIVNAGSAIDGKIAVFYLAATALFILEIILWFTGSLNISASLFGFTVGAGSFSVHFFLSEAGLGIISVLVVLLSITSATLCLLPFVKGGISQYRKLILQKIVAIWNFAWFFLISMIALSEGNNYGADAGFTFGGWLFILAGIGLCVLLFVISSKTKKLNK